MGIPSSGSLRVVLKTAPSRIGFQATSRPCFAPTSSILCAAR
jgi:hypothetical protein